MKLFLAITMGFCTFAAVHSAAIKRDSPDFVLDLYDDEQCDNQNKQIDISEHLRIFAQKPVSTTDIWRGCVVYTDPFRSVKFEIPEGSKYATRSGDDCRVDVYEGRDCQGPIIATWASGFCQDETTASDGTCLLNQRKVDTGVGWSIMGVCSYVVPSQNPGPQQCVFNPGSGM